MSARGERRLGRLRTGARIALNLEDYAHHHVYFFGTYELPITRFLQRVVEPGWTVLDVGANAGYYSLLAHDITHGKVTVHAFEPNPSMAKLLESSVDLNCAGDEITVVRAGCGSEAGRRQLHLSPECTNTGRSTFLRETFPESELVPVDVIRLDEYCVERDLSPDLVKIDVEGFEHEVVGGMEALLEAGFPRYLICELAERPGRPSPQRLIEYLADRGWRAMDLDADGNLEPLTLRTDVQLVQDVVFQNS
jgi:FkbM family methyltransferase